jgi:hypothetical protein
LPIATTENYRIKLYRLADTDPSKIICSDVAKAFTMLIDVQISLDGPMDGYVVIFDMKGFRFSHLLRIEINALRKYLAYIQVNILLIVFLYLTLSQLHFRKHIHID